MLRIAPAVAVVLVAVAIAGCATNKVVPADAELAGNTRIGAAGPVVSDSLVVTEPAVFEPFVESPPQQRRRTRFQREPWQWQNANYQQSAEATLLEEGVSLIFSEPADIAEYCPAWSQLNGYERLSFWADLLAAMAVHESRHNPQARHVERFNDRFGEPVVSRGLLQLSQESANGYGCGIRQAEQLHNPAENIRCAVRILSRWVAEDGVISAYVSDGANKPVKPWRGGARYWSVLRANRKTADIKKNLQASARCRLPVHKSTTAVGY